MRALKPLSIRIGASAHLVLPHSKDVRCLSEHFSGNNGIVVVFKKEGRNTAVILFMFVGQVVLNIPFLEEDIPRVFLVAQHPADRLLRPSGLSRCLNAPQIEVLCDLLCRLPMRKALENLLHNKCFFGDLLAQDDGIRSDLLAEYIRRSEPTPELFDLFMSYYTTTDYGAGRYDADLLQKLFSGRSEEQIQAVSESLSDQPEIFHVYRGEAEGSTPYHKAFSWSLNINTAFFFACRHGDRNHCRIIRAKVRKKDVMATKLDSKEMEVIIPPGQLFDVSKEKLLGPDSPAVMPPKYLDEYVDGRDRIKALYRINGKSKTGDHGHNNAHDMVHSARVLFLALEIIQAGKIKLNTKELEQLVTAIVYHDIGRSNDCVDDNHGKESRGIYEKHGHDPVVSFLIEYHCLNDRDAEAALQDSTIKAKKRAWLLYQILKDADALDRVRFGIYGLDVNFLRLPISHKLVPLAVSAVHGVEI